jgi:beta-galactosidase
MATMRATLVEMRSRGIPGLMLRGAPPSREFFALCDSLGIYVACRADIDTHLSGESRRLGGNPSNDPAWEGAYLDRTLGMYHTSKNHPSVAMFSLGQHSANGYNLYESYLALKALEAHRPVVYGDGGGEWDTDFLGGLTEPDEDMVDLAREFSDIAGNVGFTEGGQDAVAGRFVVENRRILTPLAGEVHYEIHVGRKVVSTGMIPVEVPPSGEAEITVPITGVKEGKGYTVELDLVVERPDGDYLPPSDPDLKVYRRLDLPLTPAARMVVDSAEFKITAK